MNHTALFTDVSLNPKLKTGLGAYLVLPSSYLDTRVDDISKNDIVKRIVTQKFENTSSTKLEVETVLWAINNLQKEFTANEIQGLKLYTDSQCVAGILGRRQRLEENKFISKSSGNILAHAQLYKSFYKLYDKLNFEVIKVSGHSPYNTHDTIHRIFSYLDNEVRQSLKHG